MTHIVCPKCESDKHFMGYGFAAGGLGGYTICECGEILEQQPDPEAAPYTIEHNNKTWISLGTGPRGRPIWPIEEYLIRTKHTKNVSERIKRLNPNGKEEGARPRGWHPKGMFKRVKSSLVN